MSISKLSIMADKKTLENNGGDSRISRDSTMPNNVYSKKESGNEGEYCSGKGKKTHKTLQIEVDLLSRDEDYDSAKYKFAVWSLGQAVYKTLLLAQMKPVDRDFLLNLLDEYRKVKKEQSVKAWVENATKMTRLQSVNQT